MRSSHRRQLVLAAAVLSIRTNVCMCRTAGSAHAAKQAGLSKDGDESSRHSQIHTSQNVETETSELDEDSDDADCTAERMCWRAARAPFHAAKQMIKTTAHSFRDGIADPSLIDIHGIDPASIRGGSTGEHNHISCNRVVDGHW